MTITKLHIDKLENKIDKLELAIKRLVLLQVLQNDKGKDKDAKEYLNRLETIAKDMLNDRASNIEQQMKQEEVVNTKKEEVKEWEKTLRFVCPSKFLGDTGGFDCAITGKDCNFDICPKRKEFE